MTWNVFLLQALGCLFTVRAASPTCTQVKAAYRSAKCCKAPDAATKTVADLPDDLGLARQGCKSQVAHHKTTGPIVGGTLYVYNPKSSTKEWHTFADGKKYVDLAESGMKKSCVPKHKPHMVLPSPDGKHTAITYTSDQDFQILSNSDHSVLFCPTVDFLKPDVFGGATHTGAWFGMESFLLLDMTGCVKGVCGGGVYKFDFTYDSTGAMTSYTFDRPLGMEGVAAARETTDDGTKPIALGNNPLGAYQALFYVTDAKGAGSILNASTMTWVKHFPKSAFGNCSGGGLWVEPHPTDPKIVLAQYGKQDAASCLFKIDMATLTLTLLVQLSDNADAHGLQFCKTSADEMTVLNTNRQTSTLDVIKYSDGTFLLKGYDMNTEVFDKMIMHFSTEGGTASSKTAPLTKKLQPDVAYFHDGFLYMAARGPRPVSAVKAQNFLPNAHPGMMALVIDPSTCLPASSQANAFALTTMERSPEITSDVHSLWGVPNAGGMEIWTLDQAGTGSVVTAYIYSACAAVEAKNKHADP